MYQPIDYDDLHRRRPYLKTHEEAMRVCMETEAQHAEGSPEYLAGMLEAFQKEKEAMAILRAMPEDSPYKEREWARMHRGTAVIALRAGQTEEAAYWAEEGLIRAYDAVVRDELFELLGQTKPERLMELFRKRCTEMNWETSCFQELEPEAHTPQNAVACLSELIAMLEGDGEMYRAFGYERTYLYLVLRRLNEVDTCLQFFRQGEDYEDYHEFMLNELERLNEVEVKLDDIDMFAMSAVIIYYSFSKQGASAPAGRLLDRAGEFLAQQKDNAARFDLVRYNFNLAQGFRLRGSSLGADYLQASSDAVERLYTIRAIEAPDYFTRKLKVNLFLTEHYLKAGDARRAYKVSSSFIDESRKNLSQWLNSSIQAQFYYGILAMYAAKALMEIGNDQRQVANYYLDKARTHLNLCRKHPQVPAMLTGSISKLLSDIEKLRKGQPVEQKNDDDIYFGMKADAITMAASQQPPTFAY